MTDDRNRYQITRIDAKNCFVESLSDTFSYGKAHLTFCTYDKSRPEGQRMTANIQIYIDIADWLELCRILDSGELRAAVAAQNRIGSRGPIREWLGGTSAKKLICGKTSAAGINLYLWLLHLLGTCVCRSKLQNRHSRVLSRLYQSQQHMHPLPCSDLATKIMVGSVYRSPPKIFIQEIL